MSICYAIFFELAPVIFLLQHVCDKGEVLKIRMGKWGEA